MDDKRETAINEIVINAHIIEEDNTKHTYVPLNTKQSIFTTLRSLTRLTIGGISLGYEALSDHLQKWEYSIDEVSNDENTSESETPDLPNSVIVYHEVSGETIHYPIVGLLLLSNEMVEGALSKLDGASRVLSKKFKKQLYKSRFFDLMDKNFKKLVSRGTKVVQPISERGEIEYKRSRLLALEAMNDTYQEAINNLSQSEEVQEMIQDHSVGLATEVVEEVRERSVSADNLLDTFAQRLFKLKPKNYYSITEYTHKKTERRED